MNTLKINCDEGNQEEHALLQAWKAEKIWEDCPCGACGKIPVWEKKCSRAAAEQVESEICRQLDELEKI